MVWKTALMVVSLLCFAGCANMIRSFNNTNKGDPFIGKWTCVGSKDRFVEVKNNNESLLWTDNEGSYPASISDDGNLIIRVSNQNGDVTITLDAVTGEMICPGTRCSCSRFAKEK